MQTPILDDKGYKIFNNHTIYLKGKAKLTEILL